MLGRECTDSLLKPQRNLLIAIVVLITQYCIVNTHARHTKQTIFVEAVEARKKIYFIYCVNAESTCQMRKRIH